MTEHLTDAQITEWLALAEKATQPPRYEKGELVVAATFVQDNRDYTNAARTALPAALRALQEHRKALDDAIDLLGDFANSYLSKDGRTVFETRGSMGRRLAKLWPKARALLGEPEPGNVAA